MVGVGAGVGRGADCGPARVPVPVGVGTYAIGRRVGIPDSEIRIGMCRLLIRAHLWPDRLFTRK